ncbi:MAG: ABC transporter ATP-binding protein/permease [Solirubrobacteraceae bacterium MAG38_C4-C5]|nr:ABC transporter ATP-binding protein/permease [Candidatus Siliceabacter maunaloa]
MTLAYEQLPVAAAPQTRRAALALARPRRLALAAAAALVVGTAAGLAVPAILGHIVDLVTDRRGVAELTGPAILLLAAAVVQGVLTAVGQALVARLGEGALAELRERVVERVLMLPLQRIERAGSGDLVARVSDDVAEIAEAVRQALPRMASSALIVGLTLVGLAALDWRLALAGLVAVPIQAHTLRWYLRHSAPVYAAERRAAAARAQQLLDSVSGAGSVRAFGLAPDHIARVERRSLDALALTMRAVNLITRFFARLNAAELLGVAAILSTGFVLVRSGQITVGQATAAALYFIRLFDPINILLALVDDAQRAGASLSRLVGVTAMDPPDEPPAPPRPADASVVLQDVRHAYVSGYDVLDGIDLEIRPGERIALIGVSGAGKTTLARVVAGIQRPTAGRVLLGGVELAQLGRAATARSVGLVSQEVHVFAGTLADDLRMARSSAGDDELAAALERVGALEWVRALPDGLATAVGDGGQRLTAQRAQQLALARIVLADHPIVILDEATAESGSTGARALEAAAAAALEGRTALVVAHRLTQAAAADRVVVMESGRIVEQGTHADLVTADGPYAALWSAWSDGRNA